MQGKLSESWLSDPALGAFTSVLERAVGAGAESISISIEVNGSEIHSIRILDDGVGYTVDQLRAGIDPDQLPGWCSAVVGVFTAVRVLSRSGFEPDAIGQLTVGPDGRASSIVSAAGQIGNPDLLPLDGYDGGTEISLRRVSRHMQLDADSALWAIVASLALVSADAGGAVPVVVKVVDRAGNVSRHLSLSIPAESAARPSPQDGHGDIASLARRNSRYSRWKQPVNAPPDRFEAVGEGDPDNSQEPAKADGADFHPERTVGSGADIAATEVFTQSLPTGAMRISSSGDGDVPIHSTQIVGATANPVEDYLKQVGRAASGPPQVSLNDTCGDVRTPTATPA